ncbi:MAG: 1-acyl-sn-glycerol-3-phosphate acyltransferase [Acidobacteriota bacterium]|nr:MAG: 1-acyl-sn-glycerol-3-phosphate acyltransferase [Acidobacteriota bacterium]
MFRGLLVVLLHVVLVPVFAVTGIVINLFAPRLEMIPLLGKWWGAAIVTAGGIRVRVSGLAHVRDTRPAVVVGNHTSHLDTYLFAKLIPRPIRVVAKASLFKIPFMGQAMRAAGAVPVHRTGDAGDIDRVDRLRSELREGARLVFFPEGTRSRDGRLRRFKKGAFVTAIQEQVPIVPMVIIGAHLRHPADSIRFYPGEVEVHFLEPVPTRGMVIADRDRLIETVWKLFREQLPLDQKPLPRHRAEASEDRGRNGADAPCPPL